MQQAFHLCRNKSTRYVAAKIEEEKQSSTETDPQDILGTKRSLKQRMHRAIVGKNGIRNLKPSLLKTDQNASRKRTPHSLAVQRHLQRRRRSEP